MLYKRNKDIKSTNTIYNDVFLLDDFSYVVHMSGSNVTTAQRFNRLQNYFVRNIHVTLTRDYFVVQIEYTYEYSSLCS